MLTELETDQRKAALDSFVAAVWKGREASDLLPLASEAGLNSSEADALVARIDQAREHLAQANRLPRLRKDAAEAQAKYDKVEARYTVETARLEAELDAASFATDAARRAVYGADASAHRLLALHDEGVLLPEMPREVAHLMERRTAEEKANAAHRTMLDAVEERKRCQAAVQDAERRLAYSPIVTSLEWQRQENLLRDRLKDAKAELAKTESKLKKAEAADVAARKAIPASL